MSWSVQCFVFSYLKSRSAWVGLMSAVFLALLTAAGADRVVVIEDWLTQAVSQKGIPSGWKGEAFGQRADYDFTIEQGGGRRVIHLESRDEHSTIARDITGKVNLKETRFWNGPGRRPFSRRAATYGGKKPRIWQPNSTSYGRGFPNSFARGLLDMSGTRRLRSQRL